MKHGTIKSGVIGWPIDHTLSPRLHGFWLKEYNIDGSYEAIATAPEELPEVLAGLAANGFAGLNVTLPHKQAVLPHLDDISEQAKRIGAVNTIVVGEDGRLSGSNTDGFGFLENLKYGDPDFAASRGPAVVLGAGGAARAIAAALSDEGAPMVTLINRTREQAQQIADDLGGPVGAADWPDREKTLTDATLLVNATVLGMVGMPELDISLDSLPGNAMVNDIVYAPLETPLLKEAKGRGNVAVDGLGMLLHQGRPGFAAWFGVEPEVTDALHAYVLAGLKG